MRRPDQRSEKWKAQNNEVAIVVMTAKHLYWMAGKLWICGHITLPNFMWFNGCNDLSYVVVFTIGGSRIFGDWFLISCIASSFAPIMLA